MRGGRLNEKAGDEGGHGQAEQNPDGLGGSEPGVVVAGERLQLVDVAGLPDAVPEECHLGNAQLEGQLVGRGDARPAGLAELEEGLLVLVGAGQLEVATVDRRPLPATSNRRAVGCADVLLAVVLVRAAQGGRPR